MGTLGKAELAAMIEEATVDAYNEDEQLTGLFTMLEKHLDVPFTTARRVPSPGRLRHGLSHPRHVCELAGMKG
jgi:hypothetical protein